MKSALVLQLVFLLVLTCSAVPELCPTPAKEEFPSAEAYQMAADAPVILSGPENADYQYPQELIEELCSRNDIARKSSSSGWTLEIGQPESLPKNAIPTQGYRLRITPGGMVIHASDRAGLLNGLRTLRQMATRRGKELNFPPAQIEDSPVLSVRGIHLMLPGYSPENMTFLKRFIDIIGQLKYNALLLQIDALAEYRRFPGRRSSWPLEQLKEINRYAREREIEIVPLLQLGGHSAWLFKFDGMIGFREIPSAQKEKPLSWSDSLCPGQNGQLLPILYDLIDNLIEVFHPHSFHLAYDEISVTEKKCPVCLAQPKKLEELYARQVNALADHLKAKNITPIIWGDQVLSHYYRKKIHFTDSGIDGEIFSKNLNKNIEIMNWYYSKDPDCYLMYNRYMTSKKFSRLSAAGMCAFDSNMRITADAARIYGWGKAWLTSWYHIKGARPDQISAMMWRSIPYFAEMSWNSGRKAAENPVNRNLLNSVRLAYNGKFPQEMIPESRQSALTAGNIPTVTAAGIKLQGKQQPDEITSSREMNVNRYVHNVYAIVSCMAPGNAKDLNSDKYAECTSFPEVGTLDMVYTNGKVHSIPLRYNWNITESSPKNEIWGAEDVYSATGSTRVAFFQNPHPEWELASLRWRAGVASLKLTAVTLELTDQ